MFRNFISILVLVVFFISCTNKVEKPENDTPIKCVYNFMQCIYKGKFNEANTIMLQTAANMDCLNKRKFNYKQVFTKEQKLKYKNAAVVFDKTIQEKEDVYLFELTDPISNKRIPTIKVVKKDKEWQVDFSYSCSGNL